MATANKRTAAVHTQEGFRIPIKITLTEKLLDDILVAREALEDAEGWGPEADALDKALLTITIPGHLQPQLVRRLGAVLSGTFGAGDIPGAMTANKQKRSASLLTKSRWNFIPGSDPPTEAFQMAVEDGIVSHKLLVEIARRYGLKETQKAVVERLHDMEGLRDELQRQINFVNKHVGVLFSDKTAKALGERPRQPYKPRRKAA